MKERLQKVIAAAGICSRRQAEKHIVGGDISVDGVITTELGTRVDPLTQQITFRGKMLPQPEKVCYLLNKPKGYVTTMDDPQGRPVVTDLLKGVRERVYPVGRLDLDTEGALLLTNDGELAHRILHPSNEIMRTYELEVAARPMQSKLDLLTQGIDIEGRKTWPAQVRILNSNSKQTTLEIIIHEGRKRQVRKMFEAIGHPVVTLRRIKYGQLGLGGLRVGSFRKISQKELENVFK
ncbi:MAG: rRNA pseudouridine synthase [Proteobacteria bacterium]|nr:rRNA pseudouridine synthase [Pseudomonadota bacterium]MBU1687642.1 rRNA pseudouridine synthase [Pseudomonadota bacterium]